MLFPTSGYSGIAFTRSTSPVANYRNENSDASLRSKNFSLFRDCLASRVLLIFSTDSSGLD